jgi:hypothetical protein
VERSGATLVQMRHIKAEEAMRWGTGGYFQKELRCTREKGAGRVRVKP